MLASNLLYTEDGLWISYFPAFTSLVLLALQVGVTVPILLFFFFAFFFFPVLFLEKGSYCLILYLWQTWAYRESRLVSNLVSILFLSHWCWDYSGKPTYLVFLLLSSAFILPFHGLKGMYEAERLCWDSTLWHPSALSHPILWFGWWYDTDLHSAPYASEPWLTVLGSWEGLGKPKHMETSVFPSYFVSDLR